MIKFFRYLCFSAFGFMLLDTIYWYIVTNRLLDRVSEYQVKYIPKADNNSIRLGSPRRTGWPFWSGVEYRYITIRTKPFSTAQSYEFSASALRGQTSLFRVAPLTIDISHLRVRDTKTNRFLSINKITGLLPLISFQSKVHKNIPISLVFSGVTLRIPTESNSSNPVSGDLKIMINTYMGKQAIENTMKISVDGDNLNLDLIDNDKINKVFVFGNYIQKLRIDAVLNGFNIPSFDSLRDKIRQCDWIGLQNQIVADSELSLKKWDTDYGPLHLNIIGNLSTRSGTETLPLYNGRFTMNFQRADVLLNKLVEKNVINRNTKNNLSMIMKISRSLPWGYDDKKIQRESESLTIPIQLYNNTIKIMGMPIFYLEAASNIL